MHITEIVVHQIDLPLVEGRYAWSNGNYVEVFDTTVVELRTDQGAVGLGECCPLGPAYLPAYAAGVRAGLAEIAPRLIGANPLDTGAVYRRMDAALKGHPYVKAAVDVACWDLLGQASGQPVARLLGGVAQDSVALYRAISQESPEQMAAKIAGYAAEGYAKFQLKVGGDPDEDIARIRAAREILAPSAVLIADANTGWSRHEAARVAAAVADLDVYIEQPCPSYEECVSIRRRTARPFVLDEVIDGPQALIRAIAEDAMDVINLKISKVGGLTRARLMRDLCVAAGVPTIIEDSWGGDVATAAIAHLAQSTPEEFCFAATDFNSYVTRAFAIGAPQREHGRIRASDAPGLGVRLDPSALGAPALRFT